MTQPAALRDEVLAALAAAPWSVQAVARAYGVHHSTITRWARQAGLSLPPAAKRIRRGGRAGSAALWGDYRERRRRARRMWRHGRGATLAEIAQACGYRSIAGAHYAVVNR